jgi:hypothetical protein
MFSSPVVIIYLHVATRSVDEASDHACFADGLTAVHEVLEHSLAFWLGHIFIQKKRT